MRIRDTGIGMSEKEIETAMEPFRQLATAHGGRRDRARPAADQGAGRGEPGAVPISSKVGAGTLVEVAFAAEPIAAE